MADSTKHAPGQLHWLQWMSRSVAIKLRDTVAEGRIVRKQLQNDGFGAQACQLYSTGCTLCIAAT